MSRLEVALLGATGVMGRWTAAALAEQGVTLLLAGRERQALEAVAAPLRRHTRVDVAVADAAVEQQVAAVTAQARVLVQCAGPYSACGDPPIRAALSTGTHVLDLAGEQAWVLQSRSRYDATARARGVVIAHGMGVEVQLADVGAHRLTAADPTLHSLEIGHVVHGFVSSAGSRASAAHVACAQGVTWSGGRWEPRVPGARARLLFFRAPFGVCAGVWIPGVEQVTIPLHQSQLTHVASYIGMPAPAAAVVRAVAPTVVPTIRRFPTQRWVSRFLALSRAGPEATDDAASFQLVLEGRGASGRVQMHLEARAPYGLSARLLADAACALLRAGPACGRGGVLAPSQCLDPAAAWHRWQRAGWVKVHGPPPVPAN